MSPEATQILWGIYTISVLGLGYWVGHRRGREALRPSVMALEQQISQQKDAEAWYESQLKTCHASGQQLVEQGRALRTMAVAQESAAPAHLIEAIYKLLHATQSLSDQLAKTKSAVRREADQGKRAEHGAKAQATPPATTDSQQCTQPSLRPPAGATVPDPASHAKERRGAHPQANLTAQEINQFAHASTERQPEHWDDAPTSYEYHCQQRMAPWTVGDPMPNAGDLRAVTCHAISVRGISFIFPERPEFESLVISVGPRNSPVYMLSEVEDHKAVYMHDQVGFLVSCRFVRRMPLEQRTDSKSEACAET